MRNLHNIILIIIVILHYDEYIDRIAGEVDGFDVMIGREAIETIETIRDILNT